jgi:soluble epoxide hydrolase / lipid-phosphate phosphatase
MNVSYLIPDGSQPFVLDQVLEQTQGVFGYGIYWYWKLFTAPDGPEILNTHLESFWDGIHGAPETWLDLLCAPDGMRNFVTADKRQPTMPYATEERRQKWIASFKDAPGLQAPLNYYNSMVQNIQGEANKNISKDAVAINVPFLFWGGQRDYVCRPELLGPSEQAGLIPDCTKVVVDSGHWAHLDKPKEFGEALVGWLKEKF